MARKSRKETAAVAVQEADAACRAAIYVRLSVEDTHTHSVSIETQQMIIARYLEQYPEISVYDARSHERGDHGVHRQRVQRHEF